MACLLVLEDSITAKNNNKKKTHFPLSRLSTFPNFWFPLCHINRLWKEHQDVIQDRGQHQEGGTAKSLTPVGGTLNAKCESEEWWAPDFLKSEGTDSSRHSAGAIWLIEISHHHWESEVVTTPILSTQETVTRGHSGVQGHSLCSGQQGCIASSCLQIKHNFSTEFHLMTDKRTLKVNSHKLPA